MSDQQNDNPSGEGTEPLTVAVTGASGFVGRYVVGELLSRGHRVRALARDVGAAARALPDDDRVEFVPGTVLDKSALDRLCGGAGACVHLVGIIREASGGQTFKRVHVDAVRAVTEACLRAGVRRYVHMSALGADPESKARYATTKFEGERVVRRSGLRWTIFRPSLIHGPDGELVRMIKDWCSGQVAPYYFLPYFTRPVSDDSVPMGPITWEPSLVQPVWVIDVAWCFAEALERERTVGEVYNLVGAEALSWPEMLEFFRDTIPGSDTSLTPWGIPAPRAAAAARAAGALGLGGLLPFDEGQALMAMEDSTASREKVLSHLGRETSPLRPVAQRYAARV